MIINRRSLLAGSGLLVAGNLVANEHERVSDTTSQVLYVKTHSDIRSLNEQALFEGQIIKVTEENLAGEFIVRKNNRYPPADNNGTYIRLSHSDVYVERILYGFLMPELFGAKGDDSTNDYLPFRRMIDFAREQYRSDVNEVYEIRCTKKYRIIPPYPPGENHDDIQEYQQSTAVFL